MNLELRVFMEKNVENMTMSSVVEQHVPWRSAVSLQIKIITLPFLIGEPVLNGVENAVKIKH